MMVSADSDMEGKLVQNFKDEGYSEVSLDWLEKGVRSGEVGSGQLMVCSHVSETFLKHSETIPCLSLIPYHCFRTV